MLNSGDDDGHDEVKLVGKEAPSDVQPRVFISYSWTSQEHQERVMGWANRLLADGVDVVLDVYDLTEGDDKYAFMERMVTDPSVTHVLVFSDREYARKADGRAAGVGVESQIISESIYNKVRQSKFIPIVCERDGQGEVALPVFMSSRIWIDFSSDQTANAAWEQLVRLLHGRPRHVKPRLASRPAYLDADVDENTGAIVARLASLRSAMERRTGDVVFIRASFLDTCIGHADELRVRQPPDKDGLGARVLEDCRKLKTVRDAIVDWLMLEAANTASDELTPVIVEVLERLLELKARPRELARWNEEWFGAHRVFVYETFLYVVASLLRARKYDLLHELFRTHYLRPETDRYSGRNFARFDAFAGDSGILNQALSAENGTRYLSPAAEVIKRQATRNDIGFEAIIESELLVFVATLLEGDLWWPPGCLLYADYGRVPDLFLRATREVEFEKLGRILGIQEAEELRRIVKENLPRYMQRISQPMYFRFPGSLLTMINIEDLGTLR